MPANQRRITTHALVALVSLTLSVALYHFAHAQTAKPEVPTADKGVSRDWLLDADTDRERFKRLQAYIRGYGQSMAEIGQRYLAVYQALEDRNFELASYHWDKIAVAMRSGVMVSPARKANSEVLFLAKTHGDTAQALKSKDPTKAWEGFAQGRQACLGCHDAEKVGYMNNQPIFNTTLTAPKGLGLPKP
jgi:hypothetical protein